MKRTPIVKVFILLSSILLLVACVGKKSSKEASPSSSTKTSQTTSKSASKTKNTADSSLKSTASKPTTNSSSKPTASETTIAASKEQKSTASSIIEPTTMDVHAIAKGDFSSVAGTWQNDLGHTLVFNSSGLVSDDNVIAFYGVTDQGVANFGLQPKGSAVGGAGLYMVPAGKTSVSGLTFGQDAMTAGQSAGADNHPFYKISDSTKPAPFSNSETAAAEMSDGRIELIRDVLVYAEPNKASEPVFTYPAKSRILCDQYFEQDGEYRYSYVSEDGRRYYFAVSDM